MNTKMVSYTWATLPKRTDADRARMKALADLPDDQIDTSDIPEWTDEDFAKAKRAEFYRPRKAQVTAMVDMDVLAWLKADGRGYQSRMNAILRREMLAAMSGQSGEAELRKAQV